jgi:Arc/MetJ-type ribon-helix-helix transcriptional regulator
MPRTYTPGPEADAIVDQLLAKGHYSSADEVARAALQLLWRHEVELAELLRRGDERTAGTGARREPASANEVERITSQRQTSIRRPRRVLLSVVG